MNLTGNTILITGATSGIGRRLAERFAALGNTVLACGRRAERLAELSAASASIVTRRCDVTDASERSDLATWVVEQYPKTNILVNNAGIQLAADLTKEVDLNAVETEVETNLIAPVHLSSLLAEHLAASSEAAIINISSGLAFTPIAFMPVYCATKAAVHSYTLSLRHQLRNTSIQVFEIAPPGVDTELGHQHRGPQSGSHGGMPVDQFVDAAMDALQHDRLEVAVGPAEGMRTMRDELFARLNGGE